MRSWSGEGLDPRDKAAGGPKLRLPTQDTTTGKEMAKTKKLQCTASMEKKCINMEQQAKIEARLKKRPKVQNVDGSQMTVQFVG